MLFAFTSTAAPFKSRLATSTKAAKANDKTLAFLNTQATIFEQEPTNQSFPGLTVAYHRIFFDAEDSDLPQNGQTLVWLTNSGSTQRLYITNLSSDNRAFSIHPRETTKSDSFSFPIVLLPKQRIPIRIKYTSWRASSQYYGENRQHALPNETFLQIHWRAEDRKEAESAEKAAIFLQVRKKASAVCTSKQKSEEATLSNEMIISSRYLAEESSHVPKELVAMGKPFELQLHCTNPRKETIVLSISNPAFFYFKKGTSLTLAPGEAKPVDVVFACTQSSCPASQSTDVRTQDGAKSASWHVFAEAQAFRVNLESFGHYSVAFREDVKDGQMQIFVDGKLATPEGTKVSHQGHIHSGFLKPDGKPHQVAFVPSGSWKNNQPIVASQEQQTVTLPAAEPPQLCGLAYQNKGVNLHALYGGVQGGGNDTASMLGANLGYFFLRSRWFSTGGELQLQRLWIPGNTPESALLDTKSSVFFRTTGHFSANLIRTSNFVVGFKTAAGFAYALERPGGSFAIGPFAKFRLSNRLHTELGVSYQGDWLKRPFDPEPAVSFHSVQASLTLGVSFFQ